MTKGLRIPEEIKKTLFWRRHRMRIAGRLAFHAIDKQLRISYLVEKLERLLKGEKYA